MPEAHIITAEDLGYQIRGRKIIDGLSFKIAPGTFTVIVGENGAGKTSLLRLLMGLARPSTGKLLVRGHEPHHDSFRDRESMVYLAERLAPPADWTCEAFLIFNRWFYKNYVLAEEKRLLEVFHLDAKAQIGNLSTGEARRLQIVAGLSIFPDLIFVDEITAVLDIVGRSKFLHVVKDLRTNKRTTIFMATNIIDDVDSYATDVLLLHRGHVAKHETREALHVANPGLTLTEILANAIEAAEAETPPGKPL